MRIASIGALSALALCAGAAHAQIANLETYEIFTLLGNTPDGGTTNITNFIDNLPDSVTFGDGLDFAGGSGLVSGAAAYIIGDSLVSNVDGTFTVTITMLSVNPDTGDLVPFIPEARTEPATGDTLFINLGVPAFGASSDGIAVADLAAPDDGDPATPDFIGIGLTLVGLDGEDFAFAPDYSPIVFTGPNPASGQIAAQIGLEANDGNIVGDAFAGFNLSFTFVPTPGAAAMLGMGGLVAMRRRRA